MMNLFFNFFTDTRTIRDVACNIATVVVIKLNVVTIVKSFTWKLRPLSRLFDGSYLILDSIVIIPDLS